MNIFCGTASQVVGASRNHHLAEEFVLVLEMTVDRLYGNACRLRDPIHGCPCEAVPQKMFMGCNHDCAVLLGDHGRFGCVLRRLLH